MRLIKSKTDAEVYAVVKANAYGHGTAVAAYLQPYVDGFCVATSDEAKELIGLAVYKPILVLGETDDKRILPYDNIVYTIGSIKEAKLFRGKKVGFYIKLNTGMNRLGCDASDFGKIMNYVRHNTLNCKGVYTHFFRADDKNMVERQYELFNRSVSECGDCGKLHCCASNALTLDNGFHCDIVRAGLALYGYGDCSLDLKPAMSVCAPIVKIRNLKRGEYVSYGDYQVTRDCRIAVIRIGYGDGYRRLKGRQRFVSVNGKRCPLVGQVCMDMCMVDISGVSAKVGDYAFVLGRGIAATELADEYGTIVYEVLTSFNQRAERVYVEKQNDFA